MFIPKLRYFSLASYRYNYDIALFAIQDKIIITSKTHEKLTNDEILEIATNTAIAMNQPLGIKKETIDDFGEMNYFSGIFDDSEDALLEYIDAECPEEYVLINNQSEDNSEEIASESSLQETIEWLESHNNIPAMAAWSIYSIENTLREAGYPDSKSNIDLLTKEIHNLIGYDHDHRDFILTMALDRNKNSLKI